MCDQRYMIPKILGTGDNKEIPILVFRWHKYECHKPEGKCVNVEILVKNQ